MSVHPGSIWIDNNSSSVPQDLWIAADANGIVAQDPDYEALITILQRRGISFGDITIAYLPSGIVQ